MLTGRVMPPPRYSKPKAAMQFQRRDLKRSKSVPTLRQGLAATAAAAGLSSQNTRAYLNSHNIYAMDQDPMDDNMALDGDDDPPMRGQGVSFSLAQHEQPQWQQQHQHSAPGGVTTGIPHTHQTQTPYLHLHHQHVHVPSPVTTGTSSGGQGAEGEATFLAQLLQHQRQDETHSGARPRLNAEGPDSATVERGSSYGGQFERSAAYAEVSLLLLILFQDL